MFIVNFITAAVKMQNVQNTIFVIFKSHIIFQNFFATCGGFFHFEKLPSQGAAIKKASLASPRTFFNRKVELLQDLHFRIFIYSRDV